ncbi:Rieske 2Fe-2S domain-containing protein [Acidiferrimicrobium sp. IK]|uniref:ubiquinol-cytochrome c reductase iron-sulfur subunit n=1 Tax=Acidiferrimicrobium sp. IK TaxID=2871700 RepID=UPI0021CB8F73|nr:Rieske 2Fe-2S domain-containing protein [Acidiferrimicrobium sp. IK]MCU4186309.1 Rieske 2Fe-2S domain-containing protein [Acidiferrimicrobium sp. IK]
MTTTDHPSVGPDGVEEPSSSAFYEDDDAKVKLHFGIDPHEPWPDDVPRGQDDSRWRFQDNPKLARMAELKIAFCWILTLLAGIGFAVTYVVGGQTQAEGALLAVGFLGMGVGLILWARDLLPGTEVTASRGSHNVSDRSKREAAAEALNRTIDPIARRPFLFRLLGLVGGVFGLAALFPIASLGDRPHRSLYKTAWGPGVRVVDQDNQPLKPSDIKVNGILTVFPENGIDDAQSSTVLINLGNAPFDVRPGTQGWNIGGLVAFSKICTHAGCPVGLYNSTTHQLVCPCHQSTFDVLKGCNPVFGPASRSLPQLPLAVDTEGYLISSKGYQEPVGPGFWNRA